MITWVKIALLLLQVVDKILDAIGEQRLVQLGYDKAMAEGSAKVLKKTQAGKAIMERVNALDETAVDRELRGLEPH